MAEHSKKEAGVSLNKPAFCLIIAVCFFIYLDLAIHPSQEKKGFSLSLTIKKRI
jgi:hypothetical protein